jgi:predicted alpha/beta hydrolase
MTAMQESTAPYRVTVTSPDDSTSELTICRSGNADAPAVLCLPAMGVKAAYYQPLAQTLSAHGYHAVLADLRGTGTSSVRAARDVDFGYADLLERDLPAIVETVCRELAVDRVIVLGHSLGGQLGLLLGATSNRVSRVALVASGSAWYRRVPGVRSYGRFFGLLLIFATTRLFGYLPDRFPFAGREARGIVGDWGREAMTGRYRIAGSSVDYEAALSRSTVPALFIAFPGDRYVPGPNVRHLSDKAASAEVATAEIDPARFGFDTSHHFRWAFRPTAVVEEFDGWVRGGAGRLSGSER